MPIRSYLQSARALMVVCCVLGLLCVITFSHPVLAEEVLSLPSLPASLPQTELSPTSTALLPGTEHWQSGVPSSLFGTNDASWDWGARHHLGNSQQVRDLVREAQIPLIRTPLSREDAVIRVEAIVESGAHCLGILPLRSARSARENAEEARAILQQLQETPVTDQKTGKKLKQSSLAAFCPLFEIGNEPDNPASSSYADPETYVAHWKVMVSTLRQELARWKVSAAFLGPALASPNPDYLHAFLTRVKESEALPDAISYHQYVCTDETEQTCLEQVANAQENEYQQAAQQMRQVTQRVLDRLLPLAVTEWNWSWKPDQTPFASAAMKEFTQKSLRDLALAGVQVATQFSLSNQAGDGTLDLLSAQTARPRPQFLALRDAIVTSRSARTCETTPTHQVTPTPSPSTSFAFVEEPVPPTTGPISLPCVASTPTSMPTAPSVNPSPTASKPQAGNPYPFGQCTWYANQRYQQLQGRFVPWNDAHAYQWTERARAVGWRVSSSPVQGSIMVLQPGVQGASSVYGHVGIVERLLSDGRVLVSSLNWGRTPTVVTQTEFRAGTGVAFLSASLSPQASSAPVRSPTSAPTPPSQNEAETKTALISRIFGIHAQAAIRVAQCESGLNPQARNLLSVSGSHASGVFQILYPSTWSTTRQAAMSPFDAQANVEAAYEIFRRDGKTWKAWVCQPSKVSGSHQTRKRVRL